MSAKFPRGGGGEQTHDFGVCSGLCLPHGHWLLLLHYLDQADLSLYMGPYNEIDGLH